MPDLTFQPLLFTCSSSSKTRDCMDYYKAAYNLLTDKEKKHLSYRCRKGRTGYLLSEIFAIMIVKQVYRLQTVKETLHLLEDNQNLCTFLGIDKIPSEATVSRLSSRVESLVNIHCLMERLIGQYASDMDRTIGHLSIDSTIVFFFYKVLIQDINSHNKERYFK